MFVRRLCAVAVLALLSAVVGVVPAAADRPAPVGDQFNLFFGVPSEYPADTPFHDTHGWTIGRESKGAGLYDFELWIDGEYLSIDFVWTDASDFERGEGPIWRRWVINFPDGLSEGTYEFTGVWSAQCKFAVENDLYEGPCGSPFEKVPVLEITSLVVFG